jgi:Mg-chelatase subunit ChlD
MEITANYIETNSDTSKLRRGGIILKGLQRTERQPIHLTFLIDTSGSMELDHKLTNVKKSMNFILPFLTPLDNLSLVTFSTDSEIHMTRMVVNDQNKQAIEYKIQKMIADGNTNLSSGLLNSLTLFGDPSITVNRKEGLIILTDGHANVGATNPELILQIVRDMLKKVSGLSITTVAYGADHNAELLSKMALEGTGSYNIVNNLEDVASVFGEILGGLLSISAQMVEVHLPPGAECETNFPKTVTEGGITVVKIGDIYAEAEQTLIFKASPDQGPIRVKGVSMPDLVQIDKVVEATILDVHDEPNQTLQLAVYRNMTSEILKKARTERGLLLEDTKKQAKDLRILLENSSFKENPLVLMMVEDLKNIEETDPYELVGAAAITSNYQHETYLTCAKGLRTPSNMGPPPSQTSVPVQMSSARGLSPPRRNGGARRRGSSSRGNTIHYVTSPPLSASMSAPVQSRQDSVFSNAVQRTITNTLRAQSQKAEDEEDSE